MHARNLLGERNYARRIVDLIEQRMADGADGEDPVGLLTNPFTRELIGDDYYLTALVEIRTRKILYEGAYWTMVTDLRSGGHLDDNGQRQLLDRLHALDLVDDEGHRRGQNMPGAAAELPAERVAEPRGHYQSELFRKDEQGKLFE